VSAVIFAIILTGCGSSEPESLTTESGSNEQEFLTTETGFPIGFTRISDGAQVGLGMSRDEIGAILQSRNIRTWEPMESSGWAVAYDGIILIYYFVDNVSRISTGSEEWAIAGGFSVGDNIQSVFDSNEFRHLIHIAENRMVVTFDDPPENASFMIEFVYNEDGTISGIFFSDRIPLEEISGINQA